MVVGVVSRGNGSLTVRALHWRHMFSFPTRWLKIAFAALLMWQVVAAPVWASACCGEHQPCCTDAAVPGHCASCVPVASAPQLRMSGAPPVAAPVWVHAVEIFRSVDVRSIWRPPTNSLATGLS